MQIKTFVFGISIQSYDSMIILETPKVRAAKRKRVFRALWNLTSKTEFFH